MTQTHEKILVFGKDGQVGRDLGAFSLEYSDKIWVFAGRADVDLSDCVALENYLNDVHPDAIINAAAYTAVDKAESEPDVAMAVNAQAPGVMACYAAAHQIPFIHISTDYVFNGQKEGGYREEDSKDPLGVYGRSKSDGEDAVISAGGHFVILRTSWVYAVHGHNFVHTMLRLGQERDALKIVADQIGAPTWSRDVAAAILRILPQIAEDQSKSGVYHLCADGQTSWHGFASLIFEQARQYGLKTPRHVEAISSSEYPTPAKRPSNSRLNCSKSEHVFGVRLPLWSESAKTCLSHILSPHSQKKVLHS